MRTYSYILIFAFFLLCACSKNEITKKSISFDDIKNEVVLKSDLKLDGNKGVWSYKGKPFNGFAARYYGNGRKAEFVGFYNGKKEGVAKQWFANGRARKICYYKKNVLVSDYITYWSNGNKAYHVAYNLNGKRNGLETSWWADGKLSKKRNLSNGKENGLQKAWLQNGKLYVNYEAKEGRIFGMRRANSCYNLKKETVIKYEDYKN